MNRVAETRGRSLDRRKFQDRFITVEGKRRAWVAPKRLETLWFNTGTLCNLTCRSCYIESSPRNDRLSYLTTAEVERYLDEAEHEKLGVTLVGFTGGEPFMNPALPDMLEMVLGRDLQVLVLTNAMKPMLKVRELPLRRYGDRLRIRVSLDHYTRRVHEEERGSRSWGPTIEGLRWLAQAGFNLDVAGRTFSGEPEHAIRDGYARLFAERALAIDAHDPIALVLFPEMDATAEVPEITTECWDILGKSPEAVMCASSRMVVKRKGADRPTVVACTLLPYNLRFELGTSLREAMRPVPLNHPHCARFCVLGGGACSRT